jgi:hypothetical protein
MGGAGGGVVGWMGGTTTGPSGGGILMSGCPGGGAGAGGCGATGGCGVVEQALRKATSAREAGTLRRVESIRTDMWILMVEAGVALFLLVFIVWWTMFAGRKDVGRDETQPAPGDNDKTEP